MTATYPSSPAGCPWRLGGLSFSGRESPVIPVPPTTVLEMLHSRNALSILFPNAPEPGWSVQGEAPKPGFERLRDGPKVLAMIRQLQITSLSYEAVA